jgi:uncharacterized protein
LEVIPGIAGEAVNLLHVKPVRPNWFACACCPPNVARLISSIGRYAWTLEQDIAYCHLFIGGTLVLTGDIEGKLIINTNYPYDDTVIYHFEPKEEVLNMTVAIRLPHWSANTSITLNGNLINDPIQNGYAYITKAFTQSDEIKVCFDMHVKPIYTTSKVSANGQKVAFSKGPLIYCAEGVDNKGDVLGLRVRKDTKFAIRKSDTLDGIDTITMVGERILASNNLYSYEEPKCEACEITLIPYYAWGNRGLNQMRVWLLRGNE